MGLRISTNVGAMTASRLLGISNSAQAKSFEKIASGQRFNQSGDDPAGLSISENMRAGIRSLGQAERNANDAVSLTQVAEGNLSEVGSLLIRLRELAIQSASDTIGDNERGFINLEVKSITQEVDRLANTTEFNKVPLLNGQARQDTMVFQVGINNSPDSRIEFHPNELDTRADTLGIQSLNFESTDSAKESLESIDTAINKVTANRAQLGALQSRLQSAVRTTAIYKENLSSARSRIADTDLAEETSNLARSSILQMAGIAVLGQANNMGSNAIGLLKNIG